MVAVKISAFGGMIPAQDSTLLPENNSAYAQNTNLDSGALQGLKRPKSVHTLVDPLARFVFRLPLISPDKNHIVSSKWLEFQDPDTNVLGSPVTGDQFDRFYFASPSTVPKYNTKARILADSASFILGIPTPVTAPGVTPSGGSSTTEIRAYTYTWVSAYGEEGPPAPPTTVTGKVDDSWAITMTAPTLLNTTGRNLTKVNIYRTITATTGTAVFYLVAQQDISDTTLTDTVSDTAITGAQILQSSDWGGPPDDLQGLVSMPNGMMVGWRENEIWFCEPFRPHAWPSSYTTSVDAKVVGLGVVGQTLVVLTEGFPYAASGVSPSNMAFSKIATFEPCMSRGSIISTAQGVFYASPNGIALAAFGTVSNVTAQLATKDKWLDLVRPETLRAAKLSASYYAWGAVGLGCFDSTAFDPGRFAQDDFTGAFSGVLVNLTDPRVGWVELATEEETTDNVITDGWSGEIFIVRGGHVLWLDTTSNNAVDTFIWRSKIFQLADIDNLGAAKIRFDPTINDMLFTLNPVRDISPVQTLKDDQYGIFRVYAGGRLVMTREIRVPGEIMRLPNGFKEEYWQFEIEARVKVLSFQVAATIKELKAV